jgi:glucan phosphoethanolaminetransferase (alkaline phosphatase superfamily)
MPNGPPLRNRTSLKDISLVVLVAWAALCVFWNTYGAIQLSMGGRALGPTATLSGAVFIVLLGAILIVTSRLWPRIYPWIALLAAALAALTIWNAFKLDPSLWPSEFWRWAGIVLNGFGVGGAVIAVIGSLSSGNDAR